MPPSPSPTPVPTVEAINARYQRAPYDPWPTNGTLPDMGVLVHCFDGVEDSSERWRARRGRLSGSLIFAAQCYEARDGNRIVPGAALFGHACSSGGVILRPRHTRIECGNDMDCGNCAAGGCASNYLGLCPHVIEVTGPTCSGSWMPEDVHIYLRRATEEHAANQDDGHYNEFEIDGYTMDANLPWSVEAFLTSSHVHTNMVDIHDAFLRRYNLDEDDFPLLSVTPNPARPFVQSDVYQSEGDPTRPCDPDHCKDPDHCCGLL